MSASLTIIANDALAEGETRACEIDTAAGPRRLILVKLAGRVHAYLNSCPHQGVRLDWQPGVFLDVAGEHLQCSMHGALFRPQDGQCVAGPCAGKALVAVALTERNGVWELPAATRLPDTARQLSSAAGRDSAPSPRDSA